MNEGAKEANDEIRFDKLMRKLDRIIRLLEILTNLDMRTDVQEK